MIGARLTTRTPSATFRNREKWRLKFLYPREALSTLITYAFETCELRRLEAEVNPDNLASNQLLLRLGFTLEGVLRKRWVAKGNADDTNIYGLLRDE